MDKVSDFGCCLAVQVKWLVLIFKKRFHNDTDSKHTQVSLAWSIKEFKHVTGEEETILFMRDLKPDMAKIYTPTMLKSTSISTDWSSERGEQSNMCIAFL